MVSSLRKYDINDIPKSVNNIIIVKGKDKLNNKHKNHVIHKVSYKDCAYSYVGQTKSSFEVRQHKNGKQKSFVLVYEHMCIFQKSYALIGQIMPQ